MMNIMKPLYVLHDEHYEIVICIDSYVEASDVE